MKNALDEEIPTVTGAALVIAAKTRSTVDVDTWQKVTETINEFLMDGYSFRDIIDFEVRDGTEISVVLTDRYREFCREKARAERDLTIQ